MKKLDDAVRRFIAAADNAEGDDEEWIEARDAAIEVHESLAANEAPPNMTKTEQRELWRAIANTTAILVAVLRGED